MDAVLGFLFFVLFCYGIAFVRNQMIFRYRTKAARIIVEKIKKLPLNANIMNYWAKYDSYGSYNKMLFQIGKWRFKAFFPDIEEFEGKR